MMKLILGLSLAGMAIASPAFAHTGVGDTTGFVLGFLHPVGGIDHVLAMVAVGLFAALLGGRALWLLPISFVTMMAMGGALGMAPSICRLWKSESGCQLSRSVRLSRFVSECPQQRQWPLPASLRSSTATRTEPRCRTRHQGSRMGPASYSPRLCCTLVASALDCGWERSQIFVCGASRKSLVLRWPSLGSASSLASSRPATQTARRCGQRS